MTRICLLTGHFWMEIKANCCQSFPTATIVISYETSCFQLLYLNGFCYQQLLFTNSETSGLKITLYLRFRTLQLQLSSNWTELERIFLHETMCYTVARCDLNQILRVHSTFIFTRRYFGQFSFHMTRWTPKSPLSRRFRWIKFYWKFTMWLIKLFIGTFKYRLIFWKENIKFIAAPLGNCSHLRRGLTLYEGFKATFVCYSPPIS